MILIYALYDPRNGAIRYIGKCTKLQKRFRSHLNEKRDTRKCRWIASLKRLGLEPVACVLECVSSEGWKAAERKWIAYFKWAGANLCNHTEGGDGVHNPDAETRAKLGRIRKADWSQNREVWRNRLEQQQRGKTIGDGHEIC